MNTTDKLDRTRAGDATQRQAAPRARLERTKRSLCNHLHGNRPAETIETRFGPASSRAKILIGTPQRLEIALPHTKQTVELISNRNKIATSSNTDRTGTFAHV